MRVSQYTVSVPLDEDRVALFHTAAGSWDIVPPEVARAVRRGDLGVLGHDQIAYGLSRQYFTQLSPEEELTAAVYLGHELRRAARTVATFVFAVTMDCNLRCSYCFQQGLRSEGQAPVRCMEPAMVDAAFAAIDEIAGANGLAGASILLFGGEPLMESTREISSHVIALARSRGLRVGAVTNGVELHLFENELGPEGLAGVQVTVDGPQAQHDSLRFWPSMRGTFADISKNIDLALGRGARVNVRINLGEANLAALPDLVGYFETRGWLDHPDFYPFVAFIETPDQGADLAARVKRQAARIVREITRHYGRRVISVLEGTPGARLEALLSGDAQGLVPAFCRSNLGHYIFAPDGAIYTCSKAIGESVNRIGRFVPAFVQDATQLEKWFGRSSLQVARCRRCPYILACGGGCTLKAVGRHEDFRQSVCEGFETLFKAELYCCLYDQPIEPTPLAALHAINPGAD